MKIFYLKIEPRSASALCFLTKSPSAQPEVTSDSVQIRSSSCAARLRFALPPPWAEGLWSSRTRTSLQILRQSHETR